MNTGLLAAIAVMMTSSPIPPGDVARLLYVANPDAAEALAQCDGTDRPRIRCLIQKRYSANRTAARLALALYDRVGVVAGVRPERVRTDSLRGRIHMLPKLPVRRAHRRHLKDVHDSFVVFDEFFAALSKAAEQPVDFRYRDVALRFFVTPNKTTPSASASGWTVNYNLNGSLLRRRTGVQRTLFHELFHLNDFAHAGWSDRTLEPLWRRVLAKCSRAKRSGAGRQPAAYNACLRPFAPDRTVFKRRNTFYAFLAEQGVGEYAAELAVRYYLEQRAVLDGWSRGAVARKIGRAAPGAFKCGPEENAQAWKAMSEEFFGGVDLVPDCR